LVHDRKTPKKWDRLEELRLTLGEQILLPVADELSDSVKSKILQDMWKEWDDANSFGGPTVLNRLRKKLSQQQQKQGDTQPSPLPKSAVASPDAAAKTSAADSPEEEPMMLESPSPAPETKGNDSPAKKKKSLLPNDTEPAAAIKTTASSSKVASKTTQESSPPLPASYDFEAQGIPAAPVDSGQFQEPCRAIATLQIARDLRNDGAVQLSSLLSAMPEDVRAACAASAENENKYELEDATARDFSVRIDSSLLDMDLDEQLQNVQTFRNIVDRQRQAREQLIRLLIQSRCKFGADEAASAFHGADRAKAELLRRKHVLTDAMELEGLDVVAEDTAAASELNDPEEDLAPLSWYTKAHEGDGPLDAKRARTDSA
jgi:hypothetical protein